jgi:hypothetical protein
VEGASPSSFDFTMMFHFPAYGSLDRDKIGDIIGFRN